MKHIMAFKYGLFVLCIITLIVITNGCGSGGGSEGGASSSKGWLRIYNYTGQKIYNMNTKPTGTNNDWENITPSINNQGSVLDTSYYVVVEVPVGAKDFKYTTFDTPGVPNEHSYPNAFNIDPSRVANANLMPNGATFNYSDLPSGGGGSSGGSGAVDCPNYNIWLRVLQNSTVPTQAPAYCAAGWAYQCAGQTQNAQAEFAKAAALGTNCSASPSSQGY